MALNPYTRDGSNNDNHTTGNQEPVILTRDQTALIPAWQEFMRRTQRPTDGATMRHNHPPEAPATSRTQATLSTANKKLNKHFGDLLISKEANTFRLLCINPQGIKPHNDWQDFRQFCTEMRNLDVDAFCLSGTDVEFKDSSTSEHFYNIVRQTWRNVRLATSTSDIQFNGVYKPGGTCMAVTGPWSGRTRKTGKDKKGLGRWSFVELVTKMSGILIICTVYQVVAGSVAARGPFTNWTQQWALLRMMDVEEPDPVHQFYTDLSDQISEWKRSGAEVMLLGDFNEDRASPTSPLAQLCERHDLGDIIELRHGRTDMATYARGVRKLDHGLGTRKIRERIGDHMRCGYLPFHFVFPSDHRAFWFDINVEALLGAPTPTVISAKQRTITSNNPKMVGAYVKDTASYLDKHSYGTRNQKAQKGAEDEGMTLYWKRKWEALDTDMRRGRLSAEERLKRYPGRYWTIQIQVASWAQRFWFTLLSGLRTNRNCSKQLADLAERLEWDEIPSTDNIQTAKTNLKAAQKHLKTCWKDCKKDRRAMQDSSELQAELAGDKERKKAIRLIRKKESRASTFKRLQSILQPERSGGLSQIVVEVEFDQRHLAELLDQSIAKLTQVPSVAPNTGTIERHIATLVNLRAAILASHDKKLTTTGLKTLKTAGDQLMAASFNPTTEDETIKLGEALLGLQIVDQIGQTKTICDPAEMFQRILERQPRHFGQATGTPFTIDPIKTILGFAGTSKASDAILRGETPECPGNFFPETELLWKKLAQHEQIPPISATATAKEIVQSLRKWREGTSTSPSGLHLGHSKALVPHWMEAKAHSELKREARRILQYQLDLVNTASKHGYSFRRWQRVVSAMIEKKPGVYDLEKLRTIHIMEADYNWILGLIFGRKMVYQAARRGMLHKNAYGSRPGKNATDATLVKELSYTISRLARHPMGSFDNDAKSCYDRVVMNLALLLARRLGVPASTCEMFALTLSLTEYYIKTLYGVSKGSYSWSEYAQVHGAGQGCKAAPALWLIVSCLLFVCLDELARGAHFADPTRTWSYSQTCVAFVDDTNGMHTPANLDARPEVIAQGLQKDAQAWERLLWSAGGALELSKCGYYILCWKFDELGNPTMMDKAELGVKLELTRGQDNETVEIQLWDVAEAHRTLGHWKNPAGVQDVQMVKSMETSTTQAIAIEGSTIDREQAWTGFWTIWLPAVGYPLPVCFFARSDLEDIQRRAINAWLPKMGISSKTNRAVVFGPMRYGGFGLQSLVSVQGEGQVLLFMKHLRAGEELATLLRIAYGWYQLNAGVGHNILQQPSHPGSMDYVIGGQWFTSMQYFLHHCNAHLQFDTTRLPALLRVNDRVLMDDFREHGLSPQELRLANYCRLYLQVECLSEICEEGGRSIARHAWSVDREAATSRSTLQWPVQDRPGEKALKAWRKYINEVYLKDRAMAIIRNKKDLTLATHLGLWHSNHSNERQWEKCYSVRQHILYRRTGWNTNQSLSKHKRLPGWTVSMTACGTSLNIPVEAFPVQLRESPAQWGLVQFFQSFGVVADPIAPLAPLSFFDHLESLDPWERMLLRDTTCTANLLSLKDHLERGNRIYIASDGGANAVAGSFGWVIATHDTILWKGKGPVYGTDPASFRAEAYGTNAVVRFVLQYVTFFHVQARARRHDHYCDNQSILDRVTNNMTRGFVKASTCLASDYDVEASIVSTLQALGPLKFAHIWVESHQVIDKNSTWDVILNDACDSLASEYLRDNPHGKPQIPWNPDSKCMLYIEGKPVNRRLKLAIREAATKWEMLEHIDNMNRHRWNSESRSLMIDWDSHGKASAGLPRTQRMNIVKFKNNLLAVNTRLAERTPGIPAKCASCHTEEETDDHLYTCLARPVWKKKTLEGLDLLMDELETNADLSFLLRFAMRSVIDPLWQPPIQAARPQIDRLVASQAAIGWDNLLRGFFSLHWATLQEAHYRRTFPSDFTKKGSIWTKRIITFLWTRVLDSWGARNTIQFGASPEDAEHNKKARLVPIIQGYYTQAPHVAYSDRTIIFKADLEQLLTKSSYYLQQWIDINKAPLIKAIRQAKDKAKAQQHDIRDYFPTT
jgi:hypothetical protein